MSGFIPVFPEAVRIVMLSVFVPDPAEVSAITVKVNVPAAVGVPVIVPSEFRKSPPGSEPLTIRHVIGVKPAPAVPSRSDVVVITGRVTIVFSLMVSLNVLSSVCPEELQTCTLKVKTP